MNSIIRPLKNGYEQKLRKSKRGEKLKLTHVNQAFWADFKIAKASAVVFQ